MRKRICSWILCIAMITALLPASVSASEVGAEVQEFGTEAETQAESGTADLPEPEQAEVYEDTGTVSPDDSEEVVETPAASGDNESVTEGSDADESETVSSGADESDVELPDEETGMTDTEAAGTVLKEQTLRASVYRDAAYASVKSGEAKITLRGVMPEGAVVKAYPVSVSIEGIEVLAAYDITIFDADGAEYQPADGAIRVQIENEAIREAEREGGALVVYHMKEKNAHPEQISVIAVEEDAVVFNADSFSIYVVGEDSNGDHTYTEPESGDEETVYTVVFHKYVWDATDNADTAVSTQKVTGSDKLEEPGTPEVEHHIFDGWYTVPQDSLQWDQHPGYRYDFSGTVGENLASWADYEPDADHTINLYSDYDPIYYVYYMSGAYGDAESYVFHTDEYHENNQHLNTTAADTLWNSIFATPTTALTGWVDADGGEIVAGTEITDDLVLYPVVETVNWIYFDMGEEAADALAVEPIFLSEHALSIGEKFPADPGCVGYTFAGWYTNKEYTGSAVTADTPISSFTKNDDGTYTLYAKWQPAPVSYTINIWRQKATDGQLGLDQKVYHAGESYDTYISYYDFADSIHVDAVSSSIKTGDAPTTSLISAYTGYGTTTDTSSPYIGFEYNRERTEANLKTITSMAADGSTIINVFYDRVTVTWKFYNRTSASGSYNTLIGLYDTNITPTNGSSAPGTWDKWTDPDGSYMWAFDFGGGGASSVRLQEFESVYVLRGRSTNLSQTDVDFWMYQIGSYSSDCYYYLEVTNPSTQIDENSEAAAEAAKSGIAYTKVMNNKTYVFTRKYVYYMTSWGLTFNFDDKFLGYTASGYAKNSAQQFIACKTDQEVTLSVNDKLYLYSDALEYTITLTSNTTNVGVDGNRIYDGGSKETYTFKYGADLTSTIFPGEGTLDPTLFGPSEMPEYYTFTGKWCADPSWSTEFVKPDSMPAYNLVAYAEWEKRTVTVTFTSEQESDLAARLYEAYGEDKITANGDGSYSITIPAGDSLSEWGALGDLTAEDEEYEYVGWRYAGGSGLFNFNTQIYEDTVIAAIWIHDQTTYTLSYDVNLDTYTGADKTYSDCLGHTVDSAGEWLLKVEDAFPALDGDEDQIGKFIGWNTKADGTGIMYYPDDEYSFENAAEIADENRNITLYAIWAVEKKTSLTLDYNYPAGYTSQSADHNPDDSTHSRHPQTTVTTENLDSIELGGEDGVSALQTTTIVVTEDDGSTTMYHFVGWAMEADATEALIGPDDVVAASEDGNILYAVWEEVPAPDKSVDTDGDGVFEDDGQLVAVGDELVYQITYHNYNTELATVTITDALDVGVDFVSATDGGVYDSGTHTVIWTLVDVDAGTEGSVMLTVKVNDSAKVKVEVDNQASVRVDNDVDIDTDITVNPLKPDDPVDPTKSVDTDKDGVFEDDGQYVAVGDELVYEITYYNHNKEAADVTITDVLDVGADFVSATDGGVYDEAAHTVTWTLPGVTAYTGGSVKLTVVVNKNAKANAEVDNQASAQIGNDTAVDTNIVRNPLEPDDPVDPEKSVDTDGDGVFEDDGEYVAVGDVVIYKITYYNHNRVKADVAITDALDVGADFVSATEGGVYDENTHTVTWTLTDVPAYTGGSVELTVKVNDSAKIKAEVDNQASAQIGNDAAVDTNIVENPLEPDDPVDPEKSVDTDGDGVFEDDGEYVSVGDELVYEITYYNHNRVSADVTVTDVLDAGADFISATDGGVYDEDTRTVTWTLYGVPAYTGGSVELTVKVNDSAKIKAEVDNQASAQIGNDAAVDTNIVENPLEPDDPVDPEKSVDTDEDGVFEDDGEFVSVGDELVYKITYYNHNRESADVTITDALDAGADFVSATDGGVYDSGTHTVTWTLSDVPAYTGGSVELTVKANSNAKAKAEVDNQASVAIGNDAAVDTNIVENPLEPDDPVKPGKSVDTDGDGVFEDDGQMVAVGDELVYEITFYNHNRVKADVTITDTLDDGADFVSATDGGIYDEGTHTVTWTLSDVPAYTGGSVELTVKANSNAKVKAEVDNQAMVTIGNDAAVDTNITVNPLKPDDPVDPTKSVDTDGDGVFEDDGQFVAVGDELVYEITFYNHNREAADVTITDVLDDGADFISATDGGIYDEDTRTVTWILEGVPAYTGGSVELTVKANSNAKAKAEVDNQAGVAIGNDAAVDTNIVENPLEPDDPVKPGKSVDTDGDGVFEDDGAFVAVGDELVYEITYYNHNRVKADVVITDVLDDGADFVSATDGGIYDEGTHTVTWTLSDVPAYTGGSVELTVVVNKNAKMTAEVDNQASAQIGNDAAVDTNITVNPLKPDDPVDPTKSVDTDGDGVFEDDGQFVAVGGELVYEITFYNHNRVKADVTITDVLDAGADFVSATDGGIYDEDTRTVTWTLEDVPAYTGGSVRLTVVVNENAKLTAEVDNQASAAIGNDAAVDTNIVENPLEPDDPVKPGKTVDSDGDDVFEDDGQMVAVGDELVYEITYYNHNRKEADVLITDVLDPGADFVSATDGGVYDEDTHTVTWTFTDVPAYTGGSVRLTVAVNENAKMSAEVDNQASAQIGNDAAVDTNITKNPLEPDDPVDPEKSVDTDGDGVFEDDGRFVAVGDELVYEITYYNHNREAADVTITDVLDAGADFVSATDGGVYDSDAHTVTWTLSGVPAYTAGSVKLTVKVNISAQVKAEVDNQAGVAIGDDAAVDTNITVNPLEPDDPVKPEKSVDTDGDGVFEDEEQPVAVGDELVYEITYYNHHREAADVTITDILDEGVSFVSATNGGTYDEDTHTVTWTLTDVPAYTVGSVRLTVVVNENAKMNAEVDNQASVVIGDDDAVDTNIIVNPLEEEPEEPEPVKPTPDEPTPPEPTPNEPTPTVKTGDNNFTALWVLLIAACGLAVGGGVTMRRRRTR